VKITFRGQRPDLYCLNPECEEHQRAFRIGACPSCGSPLNIRYSFLGKRFVGCSGYPNCRVTYPLPQRGKLEKDHPPCPVCHSPVVTAIEQGRPPWTLCINPACPTRIKEPKAKKVPAAKARAPRGKAKSPTPESTPASTSAVSEPVAAKKAVRARAAKPRKAATPRARARRPAATPAESPPEAPAEAPPP
jgi:DNA topoisomerase-1